MEKDIDRVTKNNDTDIVIRIDDFGGKRGVTIREFVKSEKYTGFTKAGTRIPADKFKVFKAAINSINEKDLEVESVNVDASVPSANNVSGKPSSGKRGDVKKKAPVISSENIEEKEF